jgi:7,8-dihydropterin-6-yl-methyl-4-(beta-D-ribofuranosyl)aminobenzene 5'-phosphate synthase
MAVSGRGGPLSDRGEDKAMHEHYFGTDPVIRSNDVTVSVLYDNRPYAEGCEPAWGFSCLVTGPEKSILFDTGGDGDILLENMKRLGLEPEAAGVVVLSHAHWDHTGGLKHVLERNGDVTIVSPSDFVVSVRGIMPGSEERIVTASDCLSICGGVYSTEEMGRSIPEQSLIIRTDSGLVVITGCAHIGIVKILDRVREMFDEDILLVMGGFHLMNESGKDLREIIDRFRALGVAYAAPCHCSGNRAIEAFAAGYGDRFIGIGAGIVLDLGDLE